LSTQIQSKRIGIEGISSTGVGEHFSSLWKSVENMAAQKSKTRHEALDELLKVNAPRLSPLVAYILASRLKDPDLSIRARIVETLANVLRLDENGNPAPDQVRNYLAAYLSQLEQSVVVAILKVGVSERETKSHIAKLLNFCPTAGKYLCKILADRSCNIEIRQLAVYFIGLIGFVEALPALERLYNRIESRQDAQKIMPFAPPTIAGEALLLAEIKATISILGIS